MAENGKNATSTIVLVHGWGLNSGVWQHVKSAITVDYPVLTPDLPGFGHNRRFPARYQLDEVVDQLAAELPDQSYLCGWSLGGLLSIAVAARYPHKVARVALVAASPCFLAAPAWPGMQPAVLQQFSAALSQNIEQTIQRFLAIQAMGSAHARADIQQLRQAISAYPLPDIAAVKGALRLLAEQDLRATLNSLTQPVSGCFGRLDALVPASIIPLLSASLPSAKFSIIEKASHAPFISHPQEFLMWLQTWAAEK